MREHSLVLGKLLLDSWPDAPTVSRGDIVTVTIPDYGIDGEYEVAEVAADGTLRLLAREV